jgi:outer membrane immunogenic protein
VRAGWTAGGGLEWMFATNWSAKIEYLYANLGTTTIQTGAIAAFGPWAGVQASLVKAPFNSNVVKAGINYHFNWAPTPLSFN